MSREQELLIEMVMRQTSLGFAEARERLEINNNNYMIVIKEALGIKQKVDTELKTLNQQIYTEIRGLMDNASDTYRKKKEMEEAIEAEKLRQQIWREKNKQHKLLHEPSKLQQESSHSQLSSEKLECINEIAINENDDSNEMLD